VEYARFTDGKTTVVVIDQDSAEYAAWPFAIKIKKGSGRFQHFDSRTNLGSAVEAAVREFRAIAVKSGVWSE
jgi:hypothetical protein